MRLRLTAGQACFVHGWLRPKRTLSWDDIAAAEHMTLVHLLSAGLSVAQLRQLQPDVGAWVRAGRVTLDDCPLMEPWGAHAIRDFHAGLAELAAAGWTDHQMLAAGLTYRDLTEVGLGFCNMGLFPRVQLLGWARLGLRRADVQFVPEPTLVRLFGLTKADVLRSLK